MAVLQEEGFEGVAGADMHNTRDVDDGGDISAGSPKSCGIPGVFRGESVALATPRSAILNDGGWFSPASWRGMVSDGNPMSTVEQGKREGREGQEGRKDEREGGREEGRTDRRREGIVKEGKGRWSKGLKRLKGGSSRFRNTA